MANNLPVSLTINIGPASIEVPGGDLLDEATIPELLRSARRELHRYRGPFLMTKGKSNDQ